MKKRVVFYLVVSLVLFVSLAQSEQIIGEILVYDISINEFEQNPLGSDSGNEWVEIYNMGNPVNLSGWRISNSDGDNFSFPADTIYDFYVLELPGLALKNLNENLSLYNQFGFFVDSSGEKFNDTANDNRTWSRFPDGTGDFTFQDETKSFSNVPTIIANKTIESSCVMETDNVTFSVEVGGFCIEEVIFSLLINNMWSNFSGTNVEGDNYIFTLGSGLLEASSNVNWTVYALDCFNKTIQNGIETFYVNSRTNLSVFPPAPNGLNGWYVTEPVFFLSNSDASDIDYKWNGNFFNFTGPFGLEGAPNNGDVTGGIYVLTYHSEVCNESEQKFSGKFDFTNPIVESFVPANNSIVYNNQTPLLSAYLEELYAQNSGINLSSVLLLVDGAFDGAPEVSSVGIDAILKHIPSALSNGKHNVTVNVSDNAGRNSEMTWFFNISSVPPLVMTINSPQEGIVNDKKVMFNISLNMEAKSLEYINHNDNVPKWKKLCNDCNEYGVSQKQSKTLKEGENNLTIRASDGVGEDVENVSVFVDTKAPKIKKTEPKKGFTNGFFKVEFEEDNPVSLFLNYKQEGENRSSEVDIDICSQNKKKTLCNATVNLSEFDNLEIEYWFNITDLVGQTDESKKNKLKVDSTPPEINSFNYTIDKKKVTFEMLIDDLNFDKTEYFDYNATKPKFETLCSKLVESVCKKKLYFNNGQHTLDIRALDEAGNMATVIEGLMFEIV